MVKQVMSQKSHLLQVISQFFTLEWLHVGEDEIETRKIADGMVNTVIVVSRHPNASHVEPDDLVVRLYGGMMIGIENFADFSKLSESEELLVFNDMSTRGWGPRLFGVFKGGRVEEYVKSHTLTANEACDPSLMCEVAKSYARFHSLKPPVNKNKLSLLVQDAIEFMKYTPQQHQVMCEMILQSGSPFSADAIATMPSHSEELEWIFPMFERHNCRKSYINLDTNFLNVLVREDADVHKGKIVLVDYELSKYGYRAVDIGGHFVNRMIRWQHKENKMSGLPFPDLDERRNFCLEYLTEWTILDKKMGLETDSVEHLLFEAEIGAIFYSCYMSYVLYRFLDVFIQDPAIISAMMCLNVTYKDLKAEFLRKHPEA